ncbi:Ig-like domain-containing protein [Chloroflexota bacterium]
MALEQADGLLHLESWANSGDSGDPFPGSAVNRTFDDVGTPNSKTYDGSPSGVAVTSIGVSGSTMEATLTAGGDLPPSVSITYPAEGGTVSGVVDVTADASDDVGVTRVEFFVGPVSIGLDETDPYETTWDSTTVGDGEHTITATATDADYQTGSDTISVLVDNVNDPPVADAGPDRTVVDADESGFELVTLDASAGGTIAFDAASSAHTDLDSIALSWSHTTSGSDGIMIVGVTTRSNRQVTSLTYGGANLTHIRHDNPGFDVRTELWVLVAPPEGTHTVDLVVDNSTTIEAGATTWNGVGALGSNAGASGSGTTASVDISSSSGEVVVDVVGTQHAEATVEAGEGQTERWNEVGTYGVGAASSEPGASTVPLSWTLAEGETWAISAVALRPAGGSYDPDGTIVSYEWDLDGNGEIVLSGETVTHDFSVGTHTVSLTVPDDDGASSQDTVDVTVVPYQEPETMHVGDLDGVSEWIRNKWQATVTITVHDASEDPVAVDNATVSGAWSGGATGGAECTTVKSGQCSVEMTNLKAKASSVTFTVTDVTDTLTYDSADNHDPDGDSNGSIITVYKP